MTLKASSLAAAARIAAAVATNDAWVAALVVAAAAAEAAEAAEVEAGQYPDPTDVCCGCGVWNAPCPPTCPLRLAGEREYHNWCGQAECERLEFERDVAKDQAAIVAKLEPQPE